MTINDLFANFSVIAELTLLAGWACLLLLVDLFIPKERKWITAALAVVGLLADGALTLERAGQVPRSAFGGMVVVDHFAIFLNILFLVSGLVAVALALDYMKRMGLERGEFYPLLLFSVSGMILMAEAADLIMVFLALELLSIPLYILAGFAQPRLDSEEASLKYFLLGSFSTGLVVYGIALVFGATGSTSLAKIMAAVEMLHATSVPATSLPLAVGAALILIGLGFKVAAVPFHAWTPDVYQGAPSAVTAFMSVGAKAGGFAALLRVFVLAFPSLSADMTPVLWVLAALTMILGNVVALAQNNIKRLLAYSSIAHAGYILMALVPYGQANISREAVASSLFYLLAYAITSFAAWAVVIALEQTCSEALPAKLTGASAEPVEAQPGEEPCQYPGLALSDYAGLGRKYPALAAAMTIAMLSFTGVPPTLGFVGKFYVFRTAIAGGYTSLALIGVLTSLVSAAYYLRVVVIMYMQDGDPVVRSDRWVYLTAAVSAIAVIVLSLVAGPLFQWAWRAAQLLQ